MGVFVFHDAFVAFRSRLVATSFSILVKLAPCAAMRLISSALNNTRLPMRMGFNFPVRCSQKSVVSPIFKIAKASARVNSLMAAGSFADLLRVADISLAFSEARRNLARLDETTRALRTRGNLSSFIAINFPDRRSCGARGRFLRPGPAVDQTL